MKTPRYSISSGIIKFLSLMTLIITFGLGLHRVHFLLALDTKPGQENFKGQKHSTIAFDLNNISSHEPMEKASGNEPFDVSGSFLSYDKQTFYINGSPVYIHSGEMHYFRTPEDQWEDYIIKARNGGINTISTVVFWGIHEPAENVWNFSGRYNLSKFIELCNKHEMYVMLRIGPMINAETRNGGIPQWVRERLPGKYNTHLYPSPPWYLDAVGRWYANLAKHISKHFPSNGGNVIKIQLDNETNCSWVWGRQEVRDDAQHTANEYLRLAKEAGFEGPFSATYWEPDFTVRPHGTLPVTGAYPLKAWNIDGFPSLDHLPFKNSRGHYHGFPDEVHNYPVFCAENQGGGGYYTIAPAEFPATYNLTDIGGGTQATNYYMYSAGSNPQRYPGRWFQNYFGNSVTHPDVTRMSYDLEAPIGEFQQIRQNYHYIRRLGMFIDSYGKTLQQTSFYPGVFEGTILGKTSQAAMRSNNGSGFVFVSSYVLPNDLLAEKIGFNIRMKDQEIAFPLFSDLVIHRNHPVLIPFRLSIDGINLRYSTANPLVRFKHNDARHLVFYTLKNNLAEYFIENIKPDDIWYKKGASVHNTEQGVALVVDPFVEDNLVIIKRKNEPDVIIKTLDDEKSLNTWMIREMKDQLIITNVIPLDVDNHTLRYEYTTEHGKEARFELYPGTSFNHKHRRGVNQQFTVYTENLQQPSLDLVYSRSGVGNYHIEIDRNSLPNAKEIYLLTTVIPFSAGFEFHADQMMVSDGFFRLAGDTNLSSWSAGIKRFLHKNTQQWVLEKQPGEEDHIIYNKQTGMMLGAKDGKLKMFSFDEGVDNTVKWKIENIQNPLGKLRHSQTGLYLASENSELLLKPASTAIAGTLWEIKHKEEFYSTISLNGLPVFLDQNDLVPVLNPEPDKINFELRSYQFERNMQRFTFILEYGDYVQPDRFTFLREGRIKLK
jgi:hypothetical protein